MSQTAKYLARVKNEPVYLCFAIVLNPITDGGWIDIYIFHVTDTNKIDETAT